MEVKIPAMERLQVLQRAHLMADLHLLPEESVKRLARWGEGFEAGDAVVFLGDLFEAWVENVWGYQGGYEKALDLFQSWRKRGVDLHLVIGNRDVLAGAQLASAAALQLHWGPLLLQQRDQHLLLIHGDELLPEDVSYQKFRRFLRHPLTRVLLKVMPLALLQKCAGETREVSKRKHEGMSDTRFQPSLAGMKDWLTSQNLSIESILAGHLHRPLFFEESLVELESLPNSNSRESRDQVESSKSEGAVLQRRVQVQILEQSQTTKTVSAIWKEGQLVVHEEVEES